MALIPFSDTLKVKTVSWGQTRRDTRYDSSFGSQAVEIAAPVWSVSIVAPPMKDADSGAWKAFLMKLRGTTNQVDMWDMMRPYPLGTMRGTMTLSPIINDFPTDFDNSYWGKTIATSVSNVITDADAGNYASISKCFSNLDLTKRWTVEIDITKDAGATTYYSLLRLQMSGGVAKYYDVAVNVSDGTILHKSDAVAGDVSVVDNTTYYTVTVSGTNTDSANTLLCVIFHPTVGSLPLTTGVSVTPTGSRTLTRLELKSNNLQGDTSIDIIAATQASKTLLTGDMLGVGTGTSQQVLMLVADSTADSSGRITAIFEPPLRNDHAIDAAVTWDKPKALFRLTQSSTKWGYSSGSLVSGFTLDLSEDWRP